MGIVVHFVQSGAVDKRSYGNYENQRHGQLTGVTTGNITENNQQQGDNIQYVNRCCDLKDLQQEG